MSIDESQGEPAIRTVVRTLNIDLGHTLVSLIGGAYNSSDSLRWADSAGDLPSEPAERRLNAALEVWLLVAGADGDDVARAWFLGANPALDYDSPAMALRQSRVEAVFLAAHDWADGTNGF